MIYLWSFLPFFGAAECELFWSSVSERANCDGGYSCNDPSRMGNVQPVDASPRRSPYVFLPGDDFYPPCYCYLQRSEQSVWYVDAD